MGSRPSIGTRAASNTRPTGQPHPGDRRGHRLQRGSPRPTGRPRADLVTTIDIDPDVTVQASQALTATGYGDVHVVTGDGGLGYADHAPYDRMIATVSPWDIPVAWWKQLAPGGRLVAPLRFPVKSAC